MCKWVSPFLRVGFGIHFCFGPAMIGRELWDVKWLVLFRMSLESRSKKRREKPTEHRGLKRGVEKRDWLRYTQEHDGKNLLKYLPNHACCSPCTSIARPKSASLTAAPLHLLASSKFSGWCGKGGEEKEKGGKKQERRILFFSSTCGILLKDRHPKWTGI